MDDATTQVKRLHLPRFREALQRRAEQFKRRENDATYWRYQVGALPANVRRLMDFPELLEALAADARDLNQHAPSP
jgi:hypothetical protein